MSLEKVLDASEERTSYYVREALQVLATKQSEVVIVEFDDVNGFDDQNLLNDWKEIERLQTNTSGDGTRDGDEGPEERWERQRQCIEAMVSDVRAERGEALAVCETTDDLLDVLTGGEPAQWREQRHGER